MKPVPSITWTEVGGREAALIQRCAAGDEDACAELVAEHQRMVYQLSLNLLGDHNEALDLSQEVFLRVFRTLHGFRGQSALRTWIFRIVVNRRETAALVARRHCSSRSRLTSITNHGELPAPATAERPTGSRPEAAGGADSTSLDGCRSISARRSSCARSTA